MPNQPEFPKSRDASHSNMVSAYDSLVRLMRGKLPDESGIARYLG